jgi:hypothetical protein
MLMRETILDLVGPLVAVELYGADDDEEAKAKAAVEAKASEGTPQEGAGSEDGDGDGDGNVIESITFSQEDMSKVRSEAAGHRVKGKETAAALEAAQAELKELKQAEMSEIEKLKSDLEDSQKAATESETARVAALADAASFKIHTSVTLAAIEAGFQDPEDALGMISQDELMDDEGQIVTKTVKARLKALADKKPYLLKQPTSGSGDGGPTGRPEDADSDEAQVAAYHKQFIAGGRVSRVG